jgi:Carboxypeptidase regulatory-like domain
MSKSPLTLALLAAVALLGPNRLAADEELATVTGVVTLNGKTVAGARVFLHVGDGQFVGAKTDENGRYKIARIPVGMHTVTVESPADGKVPVPGKYASEEQSGIRADVKKGTNEFNVDLKF